MKKYLIVLLFIFAIVWAPQIYSQERPAVHTTYPENGLSGSIIITPNDSTCEIGTDGGYFRYDVLISNNYSHLANGYIWGKVHSVETGQEWGPLLLTSLTLGPYETLLIEDADLYVPYCISEGSYLFVVSIGCYPIIVDSDTAEFFKDGESEIDCPPNLLVDENTNIPPGSVESSCNGGSIDDSGIIPMAFNINKIYPNPFNASVKIDFSLFQPNEVRVKIINLAGEVIETLENNYMDAGEHELIWKASSKSSGIYFIELEVSGKKEIRKISLIK